MTKAVSPLTYRVASGMVVTSCRKVGKSPFSSIVRSARWRARNRSSKLCRRGIRPAQLPIPSLAEDETPCWNRPKIAVALCQCRVGRLVFDMAQCGGLDEIDGALDDGPMLRKARLRLRVSHGRELRDGAKHESCVRSGFSCSRTLLLSTLGREGKDLLLDRRPQVGLGEEVAVGREREADEAQPDVNRSVVNVSIRCDFGVHELLERLVGMLDAVPEEAT